jgi:hypothetical protein
MDRHGQTTNKLIHQNMKSQQHVVLAALIVVVVATILVQTTPPPRGAEAAIIPGNVSAANAVVFGVVPCSTGSSINVATAPPFPSELPLLYFLMHACVSCFPYTTYY